MKYRTKPCEIEAVQWNGTNEEEILLFTNGYASFFPKHLGNVDDMKVLYIYTLEGTMEANIGDYIIRGLRGEYYPCKYDVFNQKYEVIIE